MCVCDRSVKLECTHYHLSRTTNLILSTTIDIRINDIQVRRYRDRSDDVVAGGMHSRHDACVCLICGSPIPHRPLGRMICCLLESTYHTSIFSVSALSRIISTLCSLILITTKQCHFTHHAFAWTSALITPQPKYVRTCTDSRRLIFISSAELSRTYLYICKIIRDA